MKTMALVLAFLFSGSAMADYSLNSGYSIQNYNPNSGTDIGHPESYVNRDLGVSGMRYGDRVMIQGIHERTNLVIVSGARNNDVYYMPLGIHDGVETSVSGPVTVLSQGNRRVPRAIVYRLNYELSNGQTGYQIITVRVGYGIGRHNTTCTMAGFDSANFTHIPNAQREQRMREQAISQAQQPRFRQARNRCMYYENPHYSGTRTAPEDIQEEGDSLETAHP